MPFNAEHETARRPSEGELRRLMNLTATGVAAAALLLVAVITYASWTANSSATAREEKLVENALNRGILRTLQEQKSVAWWDEAYEKISGGALDLEFAESEFGIFLTETYRHDMVFILAPDDSVEFAYAEGSRQTGRLFESHREALAPIVAEARNKADDSPRKRPDLFGDNRRHYRTIGVPLDPVGWSGQIRSINGLAAYVTAITILPNIDMTLLKGPPHLLVSVNILDDTYIAELGRSLLLDDLTLKTIPRTGSSIASVPLEADDGSTAGYLSWTTQRPGRALTTVVLPLVILGVIGVALQASAMLRRLRRTSSVLAQQEKSSRHAARHDALSGLPNRAHFAEHLQTALHRLKSDGSEQRVLVAFIDVDRFKDVNDTLGHSAGDQLIVEVGKRLQKHVRSGDFIARYGGDEFAILWMSADPRATSILAERIARALVGTIDIDGQPLTVTVSVGIAVAPENGTTVDELMRHADIALYEAKNAGRNRAVIFSNDMAEQVEERRAIEIDLQGALQSELLELAYQPIICCRSGMIVGVEALARWNHPTRGFVSPGVFIPIAEQAGLMPQLGEFVLRRAMQDWHYWPHLEVSVNLSPVQFRQTDLVALLYRLVNQYKITPSRFALEITEGVLMDAGERTRRVFDGVRAMGFRMALDDFGTGYSSLAYLCQFRFDKIKIDRSFVNGLSRSESFQTIIQSVISLGKGLGMRIVAEGIETECEALTMTSFGCTEMQGYYFAKPMPCERVREMLAADRPRLIAGAAPPPHAALARTAAS